MKNWCTPLIAASLFVCIKTQAQTSAEMLDESYDQDYRLELTTGVGKGININSFQATKYFRIGERNIVNVGAGMRLMNTNLFGLAMDAGPNNTTSCKTLKTDGTLFSTNIMFTAEFSWRGKVCVGANSDFFGLLFGSITPDPSAFTPANAENSQERRYMPLGGKTSALNYNLFGRRHQGNTTSEIYAGMQVSRNLWVKAGWAFTNNEMTLSQVQDRFSKSSNIAIVGLRLRY